MSNTKLNEKQFDVALNEACNLIATSLGNFGEAVNKASYLIANRIIEEQDNKLITKFNAILKVLPIRQRPLFKSFINDFTRGSVVFDKTKESFKLGKKTAIFDFKISFTKTLNKKPDAIILKEWAPVKKELNKVIEAKIKSFEAQGLTKKEAIQKVIAMFN